MKSSVKSSLERQINVSVLGCLIARWKETHLSTRSPSLLGIAVYKEVASQMKISLFLPRKLMSRNVLSA